MSDILEPCPFCGSEVDFFIRDNFGDDYKSLIIDCKECFASMELLIYAYASAEDFEKRKKEMFEAWNRRTERTAKVYHKQAPDRLYYFYCGACGEMIDCSSYEDYKSIKSYCGYCGAKLDWSE